MAKKNTSIIEITPQSFKDLIHTFRGQQVMIDSDFAAIYGYSTKDFNRQIKNNAEKFEDDFMFQLSYEETAILRSKIMTSNEKDNDHQEAGEQNTEDLRCKKSTSNKRGGRRYNPYAFTEQGVYMLMTVLKGELATKQSKILIRTFKQMKDYIVQNQSLLGQREYLQLSLQTTQNVHDIMEVRSSLAKVEDKVAGIVDMLGEVVTKSELSHIMLDFGEPAVRRGWLILNGQPVEADIAYQQIYSIAKKSIYVIDNYIGIKTLALLKDVPSTVSITIISDNKMKKLHKSEYDDFAREYPNRNMNMITAGGIFHDRYIVVDYDTPYEKIYHCGASSKDGGNKVTTLNLITDTAVYHTLIDNTLQNPQLQLT